MDMSRSRISAGLLMYRRREGLIEVFLVHPGGPYFRNKDDGFWTIPKGEVEPEESLLESARREFEEETGFRPQGSFRALPTVTQKGGKVVHAWAFEGDCDPAEIRCNPFQMEWPPKSGRYAEFPEIDNAGFFDMQAARQKINAAQIVFLDELERSLNAGA
jgi:predicted NUDIX family NTP pyrophosphohydrolase